MYALDVRRKKPRLRWKVRLDDEVHSSPAFSGGRIFVGTNGGRVYALNARTGRVVWRAESYARFRGREYFYATPAVAYGRVFIGNTDGNLYAYGAGSGRLLWASNAGTYVYSAPAVWNRTVYVGSYDGYMYAFDAATGARRWRRHAAPRSTARPRSSTASSTSPPAARAASAARAPPHRPALDVRARRAHRPQRLELLRRPLLAGRRRPGAHLHRRVDPRVRARGALRGARARKSRPARTTKTSGQSK